MRAADTRSHQRHLMAILLFVAAGVAGGLVWIVPHRAEIAARVQSRLGIEVGKTEKHFIPEVYVGWIIITYDIATAPEFPERDGAIIFDHDNSGVLETSSPRNDGIKRQEFFSQQREVPVKLILATGATSLLVGKGEPTERRIWHYYTGNQYVRDGKPMGRLQHGFFVGTQQQYESTPRP